MSKLICLYRRELLCLESEVKGRKVVRSPDWDRSHNYKGVYDMILDKVRGEAGRVGNLD
jgi:hypothetical protein